ncbi:helix-turn-helix domain-containing protein [Ureibacillus chungkukjangi]|uniref:helix-turn-helix domain-containing protein n=1 Tax=Ureibacillus chungkukjangi TaxID=1202712 RepID=UPI000D3597C1|nr:helix-turn-helix domain-containing protein [Ureibacillus chungkukjangi]
MDLTKRVGMNIRAIRKSQNLTIDELAEKCDFQSPYLSDVERGERNITLQTLNKILDALNIGPGKVLIPESISKVDATGIREELMQLIINMLEDKNEDDLRMLLNISNEIFKTYK